MSQSVASSGTVAGPVPSIDVPIGKTFIEEFLIRGRISEKGEVTYDHHVILGVYTQPAILNPTQSTFAPVFQRSDALTAEAASAMGYSLADILNATTVTAFAERDTALAAQVSAQEAQAMAENAAARAQAQIEQLKAQIEALQAQIDAKSSSEEKK